ncbi:MAG: 4-hydroxy-tetrahydrodipicolinate reductase [Bacteroidales bacterium]|nr:4-hydroxy-tetrahydrodipicolinate reductase [Bacteroidales bacterium]
MKIALIGYGRMGHEIERIALQRGHEIVSIIDIDNPNDFEGLSFGSADVAIEFTSPIAAFSNVLRAFKVGVKVVSGSTGWMDEHREEIERMCKDEGRTLFWSSNFSLGVAVFSAVNSYLAGIMNDFPNYEVSMTETHHVHKLDAPSGTAITLADNILSKIKRLRRWVKGNVAHTDELPIASIREGEVPGIHTVRYESEADRIIITHDAKNRSGLALGAVLAAEYTAQHEGLLGMNDLFKF